MLTFLLPDMPRLSSPRLKRGRQCACLSLINLILNQSILSYIVTLVFLPHLLPLLTSFIVFFQGVDFGFSDYLKFHFSACQPMPLVAEPEATCSISAKRRALKSIILLSALPSPTLNFLRLPQTSPGPQPLAQAKLRIPC